MKKYSRLFVFLVVIGLMFSGATVKAEDDDGENKDNREWNNTIRDEKKTFMGEIKENRDLRREKMETERKAFNETLKANRESFKAEVKIKKEEFKLATVVKKEEFRGRAQEMIGQRFEVAITNMERMQTRVNNVIETLKTAGKDTTDATNYLNLSKQKLAEAKVKVAEIKTLIPDSGEKITPEVFEQIKLLAREAKDLLKESHSSLKDVIKEIKNLRGEKDDEGDNDKSE